MGAILLCSGMSAAYLTPCTLSVLGRCEVTALNLTATFTAGWGWRGELGALARKECLRDGSAVDERMDGGRQGGWCDTVGNCVDPIDIGGCFGALPCRPLQQIPTQCHFCSAQLTAACTLPAEGFCSVLTCHCAPWFLVLLDAWSDSYQCADETALA